MTKQTSPQQLPANPSDPIPESDARVSRNRRSGMALCLSGGGYRAMFFHVGAVLRLNECGLLSKLERVSSVSGGTITAGALGICWPRLTWNEGSATNLTDAFVTPIRRLGSTTIDVLAAICGLVWPSAAGNIIANAYGRYLFGTATLQDLPDGPNAPRIMINATNLQSTVLWRFSKPYMRDYRGGEVKNPTVPLALAVAASSAFPPFLSPVVLNLHHDAFTPGSGIDLQCPPYTTRVVLTDGGVYDNMGLETAKSFDTVLVSDAGGLTGPLPKPSRRWFGQLRRVFWTTDRQVRALRKAELINSFQLREQYKADPAVSATPLFQAMTRRGAYWGIRTDIEDYGLPNPLPCPYTATEALADVPTRLGRMSERLQNKLMNWGYAVCDAALRRHVDLSIPQPADFPFPGGVQ